jgi:chromosome segregation ATPase
MKDYKKDFNDKLEDGSFCDGELISIANGYITEMQNIITELEKDKQYFSDSLDKQVEATLKLHKDYQELEKKNHEILKNSLDISNQFDELEEKLANADYQLEGRDLKIKELEVEKDKAWWEGFDTCKAKAGEANVKLSDEINLLKAQIEKMKSALIDIKSNTDDVNIEWQIKYLFDELEIKGND